VTNRVLFAFALIAGTLAMAGGATAATQAQAAVNQAHVVSSSTNAQARPTPLIVVVMENRGYAGVIGNSNMPYLNQLWDEGAAGAGPVTDYQQMYAVAHPSLPNYLALASGSTQGQAGTDTVTAGQFSAPSVWDQLTAAGVTWGVYQEGMPGSCWSGVTYDDTASGGTDGQYVLRHNPATVFAPVYTSAECQQVQPLSALNLSALPQVSFVTPNICDDDHGIPSGSYDPYQDCVKGSAALLQRGDSWLDSHVAAWTGAGADVLITWDEGGGTAGVNGTTNGGGRVAALLTGPGVAAGQDSAQYSHYSVLAGIEHLYGLPLLANAATANPVPLPGPAVPAPAITITQPAGGSTVAGTIAVTGTASAQNGAAITGVQVSVDNQTPQAAIGTANWSTSIDTTQLASGTHTITATATDSNNLTSSTSISVNVDNPGATACPAVPSGATEYSQNVSVEASQTGWTGVYSSNSTVIRVEPAGGGYDGLWALQVGIKSGSGQGGVNNASPVWVTSTTQGTTYTGAGFVRASAAGQTVSLTLTEKTSGGATVGYRTTSLTLNDTSWHQVSDFYTAQGTGDVLHYSLHGYLASTSQHFQADCLSLRAP
jgi:acid phosphatase